MENTLKQRIVGAVVLIGLAVIFLPAILKEKTQKEPFQSQIPAKPIELIEQELSESSKEKIAHTQNELNKLESKARKARQTDTGSQTEENEATQEKKQPVKVTAPKQDISVPQAEPQVEQTIGKNFKDAAWVIQIASFSSLDNAKRLVSKLKEKGYKAYRRNGVNQAGKRIFRIFCGPYIEKSRAEKDLNNVSQLSETKGILIPFDPTKH
ncbi:MAG: SPOR domain-containing protein [Kangiellaceae bacterium]|nr:SPOR domain-containing protein [Kangiellaceae bacterium]MCW8999803.1 SPOR domain-containing protein [Kangiellaceae bacterium]